MSVHAQETIRQEVEETVFAPALGSTNWMGLWTLYKKEIYRFLKVGFQTIAAPVVSSILFLLIFKLALGSFRPDINGIPFSQFLAPGLVMMAILTNSFANTSSSLLMAKIMGSSVDFLMPPLSPWELTVGFIAGGVTRGLLVATATAIAMIPFVQVSIAHWWAVIFFAFGASYLMSGIGILTGIWAEKFDHVAAITNFFIMPLVFLSGTFYSVKMLEGVFFQFSQLNPIFYLIDGFRFGFIGVSDGNLLAGILIVSGLCIAVTAWCYLVFRSGYRLKT